MLWMAEEPNQFALATWHVEYIWDLCISTQVDASMKLLSEINFGPGFSGCLERDFHINVIICYKCDFIGPVWLAGYGIAETSGN
ncbi:Pentatricopeptide repeat superfamily protein [Prunus dulcis]|uniref:Pentatricopeptide repeat superfamily protein n=1 Tax=Prunus dulcis TaxID=3755 RepID=A0A4Y1R7I9_PRUDU|nr:Pentatricopeptide repeat superfamily protein [Prunus dulcis]